MTAKELRIGNLVWNEVQEIPVKVDLKVLSEQVYRAKLGKGLWQPLPLTEKWLLKFGFEKRDFDRWSIMVNVLSIDVESFIIIDEDGLLNCYNQSGYLREVHYLHQLQNLYFALTGEELTIK